MLQSAGDIFIQSRSLLNMEQHRQRSLTSFFLIYDSEQELDVFLEKLSTQIDHLCLKVNSISILFFGLITIMGVCMYSHFSFLLSEINPHLLLL